MRVAVEELAREKVEATLCQIEKNLTLRERIAELEVSMVTPGA
jgi:hypothetical protein